MVLAMAVLLLQFPAFSGAANPPQPSPRVNVAREAAIKAPNVSKTLPSASTNAVDAPKGDAKPASDLRPDPEVTKALPTASVSAVDASKGSAKPAAGLHPATANEVSADSSMSGVYLPPPAAFRPKIEPMERTSHLWFALSAAEHGSAAFDAWSTRRAISQGRAEADPMMRPFAHSAAIYGAIQVVPFGLDYVARRMEHSTGWTRHVWWVPQSLATAAYVFSGSYNVIHTR
ncbi:MAG: hypothetical protein ACYDDI_07865 [Candidatus Acidiferrales bacterium]